MEREATVPSRGLGSEAWTEAQSQEWGVSSCSKLTANHSCPPAPQYGRDYWKAGEYQPWHLYKHATGNQIAKTSAIKTRLLVCLFRHQYPLKTAPIMAVIGTAVKAPRAVGKVNRPRWAKSKPGPSGTPYCFKNNLWTVVEQGITKLVWGRDVSYKHVLVSVIHWHFHLTFILKFKPESCQRNHSATSSSLSSWKHQITKTSLTARTVPAVPRELCKIQGTLFPPTMIKGWVFCLSVCLNV